jgi:hypothetical protein
MNTLLPSFLILFTISAQFLQAQLITATPTFNNIGVEVSFASPPAPDVTISMAVKKAGDPGDHTPAHPLSRLDRTHYAGSIMQLDAGTTYSIELSSAAFTSNMYLIATTRSNTFASGSGNTYHVSPLFGNNTNTGLSSNQAWRTLSYAFSNLFVGDTLLLYDGRYYEGELQVIRSGTASEPITIRNAPGCHPVLDGTDQAFNPQWKLASRRKGIYKYKYKRRPPLKPRRRYKNCPMFAYINGEHLFHYHKYKYLAKRRWEQSSGYAVKGKSIRVRFPGGGQPGTNTVTIPRHSTGITLEDVNYIHIIGLEFCYYGFEMDSRGIYLHGAKYVLVDNCVFHHTVIGVALKRAADFNTIQNCRFSESPLPDWSWHAIKQNCELGGVSYEAGGVYVYGSEVTNQGNVVRYNRFSTMFDAAHLYSDNDDPPGPTKNLDFHDNSISNCGDDAIELDGLGINVRIYNNRCIGFLTGISAAPAAIGPVYIIRNVLAEWYTVVADHVYEGYPFKFNHGTGGTTQWVYIYHNTCHSSVPEQDGFLLKDVNPNGYWKDVISRNNIYSGTDDALQAWEQTYIMDFDYDNLYTTHPTKFINWGGTLFDTLSAFATATGQEQHGMSDDPAFVDAAGGNYHLQPSSTLIDQGIVIPGVNDGYTGTAPDLGAFEQ